MYLIINLKILTHFLENDIKDLILLLIISHLPFGVPIVLTYAWDARVLIHLNSLVFDSLSLLIQVNFLKSGCKYFSDLSSFLFKNLLGLLLPQINSELFPFAIGTGSINRGVGGGMLFRTAAVGATC